MNQNLYFSSKQQWENFKSYLQLLHSGSESACYRYQKQVLKELNGPCASIKTEEEALQFKDITFNSFVFVQGIIFVKSEIIGYIMPYIEGDNLSLKPIQYWNYNQFLKACSVVCHDLEKLSEIGILTYDVFDSNILYNGKSLTLIDTSDYFMPTAMTVSQLKRQNLIHFTRCLYMNITNDPVLDQFLENSSFFTGQDLKNEYLENPLLFLQQLKEQLTQECKKRIIRLEDGAKILRKGCIIK